MEVRLEATDTVTLCCSDPDITTNQLNLNRVTHWLHIDDRVSEVNVFPIVTNVISCNSGDESKRCFDTAGGETENRDRIGDGSSMAHHPERIQLSPSAPHHIINNCIDDDEAIEFFSE